MMLFCTDQSEQPLKWCLTAVKRVYLACNIRCLKSLLGVVIVSLMGLSQSMQIASAQDKSRMLDYSVYQSMLKINKKSGWVSFRNYDGRQLIYFTTLQTLHCRLKEIRYSINSKQLDKVFDLVKCNPQNPFALPSDSGLEDILIKLPIGTAKTVAVQVIWEDDAKSEIGVFEPCKDVGDQTCSWTLE